MVWPNIKLVCAWGKAVNGTLTTNPFNFENCGIKHIKVYADGLPVGGNPLKLDFDAAGGDSVMRAYTNLLLVRKIETR